MPVEVTLRYMAGPTALQFHRDTESRAKLLLGPRGTGKTSSCAYDLIRLASGRIKPDSNGLRRSKFLVIRNTHDELKTTAVPTYLEWFPEELYGAFNWSDMEYRLEFDDRQIEILFRGLDKPGVERKLLSLELSGAHIEEAREVKPSVIKAIMASVGRFPGRKDYNGEWPFTAIPQSILSSNYPGAKSWLAQNFDFQPQDGFKVYKQDPSENNQNLPPNYYEDLAATFKDSPYELATLVRGEYGTVVTGRPVYPNFKRELHVSKTKLEPVEALVLRGWDNTGLSPACVVTQMSSTGQWLVLKEFCGFDCGISEFGEAVTLWCNQTFDSHAKYRDIGDPAGSNRDSNKMSPALYLAKQGIHIEDGIQTLKTRKEAVDGRLTKLINGLPAIVIDPADCDMLIEGFEGGYHHKEIGNSGIYSTDPEKNEFSHIHDALQYLSSKLFLNSSQQTYRERPAPPAIFVG